MIAHRFLIDVIHHRLVTSDGKQRITIIMCQSTWLTSTKRDLSAVYKMKRKVN